MSKAVQPIQDDLFRVRSSKGDAAQAGDDQRKLKATQLFNHLFEACDTLRGSINQDEFNVSVIPMPQLPLQREFAAFVERVEKAKASLKASLAALTAAQKALMNQVFQGG